MIDFGIGAQDIVNARKRIAPYIKETPVFSSSIIDEKSGGSVLFKGEHLQKTGSFKVRGAFNMVLRLREKGEVRGIATHSSGNHAQAVAYVASQLGIPAYIVMPKNAPSTKVEAVKYYGGNVRFCEPTLKAREETLQQWLSDIDATFIPPYNHPYIVEGQATLTAEWLEQHPELKTIVIPIGGGGLISGALLAVKALGSDAIIIGAEPAGADDAYRSLKTGERITSHTPDTIADGLLVTLGDVTFPIIKRELNQIVRVSDDEIKEALLEIYTFLKQAVEPSAAVAYAVVKKLESQLGFPVGALICGGNTDYNKLPF